MSRRIIVPRGLINPNNTTVIEIPDDLENETDLIATRAGTSNTSTVVCRSIGDLNQVPNDMTRVISSRQTPGNMGYSPSRDSRNFRSRDYSFGYPQAASTPKSMSYGNYQSPFSPGGSYNATTFSQSEVCDSSCTYSDYNTDDLTPLDATRVLNNTYNVGGPEDATRTLNATYNVGRPVITGKDDGAKPVNDSGFCDGTTDCSSYASTGGSSPGTEISSQGYVMEYDSPDLSGRPVSPNIARRPPRQNDGRTSPQVARRPDRSPDYTLPPVRRRAGAGVTQPVMIGASPELQRRAMPPMQQGGVVRRPPRMGYPIAASTPNANPYVRGMASPLNIPMAVRPPRQRVQQGEMAVRPPRQEPVAVRPQRMTAAPCRGQSEPRAVRPPRQQHMNRTYGVPESDSLGLLESIYLQTTRGTEGDPSSMYQSTPNATYPAPDGTSFGLLPEDMLQSGQSNNTGSTGQSTGGEESLGLLNAGVLENVNFNEESCPSNCTG